VKPSSQVIIIGGGPAGMMAAISCKHHHPDVAVILLERNSQLGTKLLLTGGGRCNITANLSSREIIKHTPHQGKFLFSSLNQFNAQDLQQFFIERGCLLKEEDHQRIFPISDKAQDIMKVLEEELRFLNVQIELDCFVESVDYQTNTLNSTCGTWKYDHLIFATGGKSYAHTGSDGEAFKLIAASGHTITPLLPAEVPLVSNDAIIQSKLLQGLSFKDCVIDAYVNDRRVSLVKHDMIITHFGLSGPGALQTSSYLVNEYSVDNNIQLLIDFLPDISYQQLKQELELQTFSQCMQSHQIPKRLIKVINETSSLSADPLMSIKKFPITIHGSRGFASAFVTCGGVKICEISPKTMTSKLVPNLSVCGEALDVNSLTGGFNMTVAFSTGYCAGKYAE
jgi:predicted Rossmann fold flavoprotein